MRDAFYTPAAIAEALISYLPDARYECIADFAAGDGALLAAAEQRFPTARIIANDISKVAVRRLQQRHPAWKVTRADFLVEDQAAAAVAGGEAVDLALLNPPFSCRGGTRLAVALNEGTVIECSRAMAFLLRAVQRLSAEGHLAFLIPSGCLFSEKDRAARQYLTSRGRLDMRSEHPRGSFPKCFPTVTAGVFRLGPAKTLVQPDQARASAPSLSVSLVRGTIQMHTLKRSKTGKRLVHSTDLLGGSIEVRRLARATNAGPTIVGPAVLVPRVGTPRSEKLCLYFGKRALALSDCVIGVRCTTNREALRLRRAMRAEWETFYRLYTGTCARFISMARLSDFVASAGFVQSGRSPRLFRLRA